MPELTFSNNVLKLYTNKSSSIFALAGESISDNINGKYGIIFM